MDMFVFAKRLKECRKSKHISAIELGEVAGVRSATIHRYENAEFKSIKQDRLEAMAKYLGVSVDYLTGNSNEKFNPKLINENYNFEITNILYLAKDLLEKNNVVLDGKPISKELLEPICDSLEVVIEIARRKNK